MAKCLTGNILYRFSNVLYLYSHIRLYTGISEHYFSVVIIFITNKFTIMKKLLIMLVTAAVLVSCAKEKVSADNSASTASSASRNGTEDNIGRPPQAVLNAFAANFGNVAVSQWKLRSDGTWRAHFTRNGVAWEATFTAAGTLIKSEAAR